MANLEHNEDDPKHATMSGEAPTASVQLQPAGLSTAPGRDAYATPCAIPSFAAASELLSAPYSCLVMNTHRRHVALPPMYLHKKRTGIQGELETELLKFSESLKGVPLAYDNIRIVGPHGNVYDDSSYIHMDVEANFIVFQPTNGQKLLGKVNKLGISHVGCLVHGCFNASIPKPNPISVETWRDAGPRIGTDLEFEVTALDSDTAGVLLIRGQLDRTRLQELMAVEDSETCVPADQPDTADTEPNPETTEESPDVTPKKKKKKKKKKDKVKEDQTEDELTPSCQQDSITTSELNESMIEANGNEVSEKKKKKKKVEHVKEKEEEEIELSTMDIHGSDSSGYLSDKQSKKRKNATDSDVTSGFSEDPEPPKSKKKRKSDIQQFA